MRYLQYTFLIKEITGLKPETTYQVQFDIELASNTPAGLMGIGGHLGRMSM
jgi:hypothetical protein